MSEKREPGRLTVDDLEKMTTHDLADLLANVVLVLKRLPDVPMKELKRETGDGMGGKGENYRRATYARGVRLVSVRMPTAALGSGYRRDTRFFLAVCCSKGRTRASSGFHASAKRCI